MVNHSQLWRGEECSFVFAANRIETVRPYSAMCLSSLITNESLAAFGQALDPAKCNIPGDLWEAMEMTGVPFITVPHHPSSASHPSNLNLYNPKYDRLYEIYSSWGSSE